MANGFYDVNINRYWTIQEMRQREMEARQQEEQIKWQYAALQVQQQYQPNVDAPKTVISTTNEHLLILLCEE